MGTFFVPIFEAVPAGSPPNRGHAKEENQRSQNIARNSEGCTYRRQHDARGTPVNRVAHACERSHQTNLHVGNGGIVNTFFTGCLFALHSGSHTHNGGRDPGLGVEELQVTGECFRLIFLLGVETFNRGYHRHRKTNGLHTLEVEGAEQEGGADVGINLVAPGEVGNLCGYFFLSVLSHDSLLLKLVIEVVGWACGCRCRLTLMEDWIQLGIQQSQARSDNTDRD